MEEKCLNNVKEVYLRLDINFVYKTHLKKSLSHNPPKLPTGINISRVITYIRRLLHIMFLVF